MRSALAIGSTLALALAVLAQTTTQPGNGTRPGSTQPGSGKGSGTGSGSVNANASLPTPLYSMNGVSKSLNLNNDQMSKLNDLNSRLQERFRSDYEGLGSVSDANDRTSRLDKLNQQFSDAFNTGARDIFNKDQLSRYNQLQLQYGGFTSLQNPDVQTQLNLTADQKQDLANQLKWQNQQTATINGQASTDPDVAAKAYGNYQTQLQTRMSDFLTPQQQQAWTKMTGERYTFSPSFATPRR